MISGYGVLGFGRGFWPCSEEEGGVVEVGLRVRIELWVGERDASVLSRGFSIVCGSKLSSAAVRGVD